MGGLRKESDARINQDTGSTDGRIKCERVRGRDSKELGIAHEGVSVRFREEMENQGCFGAVAIPKRGNGLSVKKGKRWREQGG
jgi:hypothetical protein